MFDGERFSSIIVSPCLNCLNLEHLARMLRQHHHLDRLIWIQISNDLDNFNPIQLLHGVAHEHCPQHLHVLLDELDQLLLSDRMDHFHFKH